MGSRRMNETYRDDPVLKFLRVEGRVVSAPNTLALGVLGLGQPVGEVLLRHEVEAHIGRDAHDALLREHIGVEHLLDEQHVGPVEPPDLRARLGVLALTVLLGPGRLLDRRLLALRRLHGAHFADLVRDRNFDLARDEHHHAVDGLLEAREHRAVGHLHVRLDHGIGHLRALEVGHVREEEVLLEIAHLLGPVRVRRVPRQVGAKDVRRDDEEHGLGVRVEGHDPGRAHVRVVRAPGPRDNRRAPRRRRLPERRARLQLRHELAEEPPLLRRVGARAARRLHAEPVHVHRRVAVLVDADVALDYTVVAVRGVACAFVSSNRSMEEGGEATQVHNGCVSENDFNTSDDLMQQIPINTTDPA